MNYSQKSKLIISLKKEFDNVDIDISIGLAIENAMVELKKEIGKSIKNFDESFIIVNEVSLDIPSRYQDRLFRIHNNLWKKV